jgi:ATP-binding protein involved in chromosome partitioning
MLTREQVLEALQGVRDPGLGRSLAEIGWIRDIMIRSNGVSLTAVLSDDREDWFDMIKYRIREELSRAGVEQVHVRVRKMTEMEARQAGAGAQAGSGAGASAGQPGAGASQPGASAGAGAGSGTAPRAGGGGILDPSSGVQFIAVASGKGGVGKSTVTVNLAVALARLGKKVGIVDADIYGFSVPDMMGIEERPAVVNERVRPVERFGVKVISMGFFVQDNSPVIWRGPMLGKMLRNFFHEVDWGDIEYMLLDLPPGTGDVALDIHQMIPQSKELLVTTPHATAAFVAARAGAMARHTNHELLGVVENMAWYACGACGHKDYVFGRGGGAKLASELHTDLLAQIPLGDPDNHPAEPDYSPSVYKADSEIGLIYADLARKVVEKTAG